MHPREHRAWAGSRGWGWGWEQSRHLAKARRTCQRFCHRRRELLVCTTHGADPYTLLVVGSGRSYSGSKVSSAPAYSDVGTRLERLRDGTMGDRRWLRSLSPLTSFHHYYCIRIWRRGEDRTRRQNYLSSAKQWVDEVCHSGLMTCNETPLLWARVQSCPLDTTARWWRSNHSSFYFRSRNRNSLHNVAATNTSNINVTLCYVIGIFLFLILLLPTRDYRAVTLIYLQSSCNIFLMKLTWRAYE